MRCEKTRFQDAKRCTRDADHLGPHEYEGRTVLSVLLPGCDSPMFREWREGIATARGYTDLRWTEETEETVVELTGVPMEGKNAHE